MRLLLIVLATLYSATALGQEPTPGKVWTEERKNGGVRILETVFQGQLIAHAPANGLGENNAGGVIALVAHRDRRELYLIPPNPPSELTPWVNELPTEADAVAVWTIGGEPVVVIGTPGKLYSIGRDGVTRLLLEADDLELGPLLRDGFVEPGPPLRLHVPRIGTLSTYVERQGRLVPEKEVEVPVRARREATGMLLYSLPVQGVTVRYPQPESVRQYSGQKYFAVGPETIGDRRLRTLLVGRGGDPQEAWAALPGAENFSNDESLFTEIGDRPALLAVTTRADKVGIFSQKNVRVFVLKPRPVNDDKGSTQAGLAPSFAVETVSKLWQRADPLLTDIDGDGLDDLVVVQMDGISGKKLQVDAFLGRGNGRFQSAPRRSKVPMEDATWRFGHDFNGDGLADLVARSGRDVRLYPGVRHKKMVLAKESSWQLNIEGRLLETVASQVKSGKSGEDGDEVETPRARPRGRGDIRDLDNDGEPEILIRGIANGWSVLWWLDPS